MSKNSGDKQPGAGKAVRSFADADSPEIFSDYHEAIFALEHIAASRMASIFPYAIPLEKIAQDNFVVGLHDTEYYRVHVRPAGVDYVRAKDLTEKHFKIVGLQDFSEGVTGYRIGNALRDDDIVTILYFDSRELRLLEKSLCTEGDGVEFFRYGRSYHRYMM